MATQIILLPYLQTELPYYKYMNIHSYLFILYTFLLIKLNKMCILNVHFNILK